MRRPSNLPCIGFRPHHINQSTYSVLKQKNVYNGSLLQNVHFKIDTTSLIFRVTSLNLNNCFHEQRVQILHHLHKYKMLFFVDELPQHYFGSGHICSMAFK